MKIEHQLNNKDTWKSNIICLFSLFVMKIYLNNYKQSSGISTNINTTLLTKGTIDDDMMRAILNVTDDLYL